MSTHISHTSKNHPSTHVSTHSLLYPPSTHKSSTHVSTHKPSTHVSAHKPSTHVSTHKPSTHVSTHKPSTHASTHKPSTHKSSMHKSSMHESFGQSFDQSVHPSMYSMMESEDLNSMYEPTPVEEQEVLADNCYDNYQLMINVFMKLSTEFDKISNEVDQCISMAQKAFEMVDFTQYDDFQQYNEDELMSDVSENDEIFSKSASMISGNPSVRFSHKTIMPDDPTMEPSRITLFSDQTKSNARSLSADRLRSSDKFMSGDKSFTTSVLDKNSSIARSLGGEKSVMSLKKSIAASIMSGKSLAETNQSISRKVLEDNKSVLSNKSGHKSIANKSIVGKSIMSLNPSIAKSRVSHATLANPSIAKSRVSHATLANNSKSMMVEEPMSINQPLYIEELPEDELKQSTSLGKSMISGIKSIMSQGKSMMMGRSSGSFDNSNRRSRDQSLGDSKMIMRSSNSVNNEKSFMGSLTGSRSGAGKSFGSLQQSEKPSMMSRIKSLFSRTSTQNNEQDLEDEEIDPFAVQRRFVDLWERIIGKLAITSSQFKALSELTKDPAIIPNDAFEIPIMELPTHADGLPLSADELIHALHNMMVPNKPNQSKVHSLIINVIVAHCEIRNAERFLQQLSEKMEIQPKHLKSLTAKRIERTKQIVRQCGNELVASDPLYENYMNAYYEALERNYPPALGTLESPPLKHSPTCPSQIEAQQLAIYEIRDQYIRERISTFDNLVTSWLLDYTNIAKEASDMLSMQDEGINQK